MHFSGLAVLSLLSCLVRAQNTPKHGEGEEGKSMGPVAFLWPSDRPWTVQDDNIAPCGSPNGPSNRTLFPLDQGSVALSIADDAWHVAFRISYENDPKQQSDFGQQVVPNVTDIVPGHQCYKIGEIPSTVGPGANATIQLEYWAEFEGENNGNNQSFFACADVTFVEATDFKDQVPCFNVTSDDFNAPTPSTSASGSMPTASNLSATSPASSLAASSSSGGGPSAGAKAGIAVGSIVGAAAIIGAIAFLVLRRRKSAQKSKADQYELRAKTLST
ncbi:hypothetical protein K469DRAFT_753887 [Zopfia rhizophila CBS 207.26]|uniref:Copper acquisition factor BIM1-like domain-containing protein n=1 Tax=Zopfia rhizophila CBS 207.26 TaxID=1314779 RepID=A0A6A6DMP6_9PEZI|nr:hypothetical protein K469DRAFT_753887 [Zopfia rhizophila CBS 207.26]